MKSFWALKSSSFKEFNHDFEFLWERRFDDAQVPIPQWLPRRKFISRLLTFQMFRVGIWEHESDGIDGKDGFADTASWDRQYLQAILGGFYYDDPNHDDHNFNLDIKIWRLFSKNRPFETVSRWPWQNLKDLSESTVARSDTIEVSRVTTADATDENMLEVVQEMKIVESTRTEWNDDRWLNEHLGRFEIRPVYTFMGDVPADVPFRFQAAATLRKLGLAKEPDTVAYRKGSVQMDLKWALPMEVTRLMTLTLVSAELNPIFYAQYFRGYGENIRDFIGPVRFEDDAFVDGEVKVGLQLKH